MSIIESQADPVQCCLKGQMFACPSNPVRRDIELCPLFMGQRCARQWDGFCELYLGERDDENVHGVYSNEFLRNAFEEMFCQLMTNNPDSMCYKRCEMFDPVSGTSPSAMVCKTFGDVPYRESYMQYSEDGAFNQFGLLSTASPIKMTSCPKQCNVYTNLTDSNRLLNIVLDRGACPDLVMNLAQNIVANKVQYTNRRLAEFINRYIIKSGYELTPGFSSLGQSNLLTVDNVKVPAVDPRLQPNINYVAPTTVNTTKFNDPVNPADPTLEKFNIESFADQGKADDKDKEKEKKDDKSDSGLHLGKDKCDKCVQDSKKLMNRAIMLLIIFVVFAILYTQAE
jgi:hypothetical protein